MAVQAVVGATALYTHGCFVRARVCVGWGEEGESDRYWTAIR